MNLLSGEKIKYKSGDTVVLLVCTGAWFMMGRLYRYSFIDSFGNYVTRYKKDIDEHFKKGRITFMR